MLPPWHLLAIQGPLTLPQVWTLDCRVTAVAADHPSRRAAAALAGALAAVPEPFPSPDTLFEAAKQLLDPTGAKGGGSELWLAVTRVWVPLCSQARA